VTVIVATAKRLHMLVYDHARTSLKDTTSIFFRMLLADPSWSQINYISVFVSVSYLILRVINFQKRLVPSLVQVKRRLSAECPLRLVPPYPGILEKNPWNERMINLSRRLVTAKCHLTKRHHARLCFLKLYGSGEVNK
jgi:hypothetical protein